MTDERDQLPQEITRLLDDYYLACTWSETEEPTLPARAALETAILRYGKQQVTQEVRVRLAQMLRAAFHELDTEPPRPWEKIGEDQKGWLDLADAAIALLSGSPSVPQQVENTA